MPPRGGQQLFGLSLDDLVLWFQYMPPRGGQQRSLADYFGLPTDVSIHAPTRGATTPKMMESVMWLQFQYMPPRGGQQREYWSCYHANTTVSIHAPTRGATSAKKRGTCITLLFQYMPPRGGQHVSSVSVTRIPMFQYMPPRGGQQVHPAEGYPPLVVSIHAPTRGATTYS